MNFEVAPKSTEITANWDNARLYCMFLDIDGKTDWRLPTKDELNEIYESQNDFIEAYYWSSTEFDTSNAWLQSFNYRYQISERKRYEFYVRAIRDIK